MINEGERKDLLDGIPGYGWFEKVVKNLLVEIFYFYSHWLRIIEQLCSLK